MADKIKLRRDTQNNWEAVNPILDEGELGVIIDRNTAKIGDGTQGFNDLLGICGSPEGWINVKDFGAKGAQGIDDTQAIQDAINYAPELSTVFIPAGRYRIYNTITINKPINFIMDGYIHYYNTGTCILINSPSTIRTKIFKFNLIKGFGENTDFTDQSTAVRVESIIESSIIIHHFEYFTYGFRFETENSHVSGTHFWGPKNYQLKYLYYIRLLANSWFNENTFFKINNGGGTSESTTFFLDCSSGLESNGNVFIQPSIEGHTGFDLNDTQSFKVYDLRQEAYEINLKAKNSTNIDITHTYPYYSPKLIYDISYDNDFYSRNLEPHLPFIDFTKLFSQENLKVLKNTSKVAPIVYYDEATNSYSSTLPPEFYNNVNINNHQISYTYTSVLVRIGFLLKLNSTEVLKIVADNSDTSVSLIFLDENFTRISPTIALENIACCDYGIGSGLTFSLNSSNDFPFTKEFWINKDSNIKYILISPFARNASGTMRIQNFTIFTESADSEILYPETILPSKDILYGPSSNRPTTNYIGQLYFDTDLKKDIVWNGTSWVNLNGSTL